MDIGLLFLFHVKQLLGNGGRLDLFHVKQLEENGRSAGTVSRETGEVCRELMIAPDGCGIMA